VSRRHGDFALAAAAVLLDVRDGRISHARIAVTGVDATPRRFQEIEGFLTGQPLSIPQVDRIPEIVQALVTPETDLHASADYRRHLAGVLVQRAVYIAWRSGGGESLS
jgi:carbon-monoxide dehydrogenase medium subunit